MGPILWGFSTPHEQVKIFQKQREIHFPQPKITYSAKFQLNPKRRRRKRGAPALTLGKIWIYVGIVEKNDLPVRVLNAGAQRIRSAFLKVRRNLLVKTGFQLIWPVASFLIFFQSFFRNFAHKFFQRATSSRCHPAAHTQIQERPSSACCWPLSWLQLASPSLRSISSLARAIAAEPSPSATFFRNFASYTTHLSFLFLLHWWLWHRQFNGSD